MQRKYIVKLTKEERESLDELILKGEHRSKKVLNALILLGCDEGEFQPGRSINVEISRVLNVSERRIDKVKGRYIEGGIQRVLERKMTRVYKKKTDGDFEGHLVALSCSEPPEGFARWSLRLLADKMVKLAYIDTISHESVRETLKKTKSSHGKRKSG